jgi:hypothetical protein
MPHNPGKQNVELFPDIKNICKKAVQQLNILKCIGKNLSKLNRLTIFHTFVLSNFNTLPLYLQPPFGEPYCVCRTVPLFTVL